MKNTKLRNLDGKLRCNLKICNVRFGTVPDLRTEQSEVVESGLSPNYTIHSPQSKGFTLIEVLLSLVLLTIILGVVYSSFFTVQRALERFDDISLKYHEVRTVLDLMRREIDGALLKNPQTSNPDNNNNQTTFVIEDRDILGKPTSRLHLTAFSFKGSGLKAISYYVQEKDENLVLVKMESLPFTLPTGKSQTKVISSKGYTLEMIEGIEGFTVETLFNNKWIKTWDTRETGTLPEVVRFSIEFDDKGKKVKLTEYARPKIGKQL